VISDISFKLKFPNENPCGVITICQAEITRDRPESSNARTKRRRSEASSAEGVKCELAISSPIGLAGH
jgi:hypothetical protein